MIATNGLWLALSLLTQPPADSVVIDFDARVPMRDGVTLAADVPSVGAGPLSGGAPPDALPQNRCGAAQGRRRLRCPLAPMADPCNDGWIAGPGGLPTPTMISWYHLTAGKVLQNMDAIAAPARPALDCRKSRRAVGLSRWRSCRSIGKLR